MWNKVFNKSKKEYSSFISGRFLLLNTFGTKVFRWNAKNLLLWALHCIHVIKFQLENLSTHHIFNYFAFHSMLPINKRQNQVKFATRKLWNYLLQVFLVRFSSFLPSNDWRNLTIPVYTGYYIQLFHYSHANFEEFVAGRKKNLTRRIFFQHYYSMSEINNFQRYRANFVKAFFLYNS